MPSEQFYDGLVYDPIRAEIGSLLGRTDPTDMDLAMRVYESAPETDVTPQWVGAAPVDEVFAMLLAILACERWISGFAAPPHRNGALSAALERVAGADLAIVIR